MNAHPSLDAASPTHRSQLLKNPPDLSSLNWDDIKYFLALYRCRRLSLAAQKLGTSRATISNRIQSLEAALGIPLFRQEESGFFPSPAGIELLPIAEDVEKRLSLDYLGEHLQKLDIPMIRIGVNEGLSDNVIALTMAEFAKQQPTMIKLMTLPKNTNVATKEVDISITIQPSSNDLVLSKILTDYKLGIYSGTEYAKILPPHLEASQLGNFPWIGYIEELMYSESLLYHLELPEKIKFSFQSTSLNAQIQATIANLGLCILPCYIAENTSGLIRVFPEIGFKRTYWISTRRDIIGSKKLKEIWNFLVSRFKKDRSIFMDHQ